MTVQWGCGARLQKREFPHWPSGSHAASELGLVVPPCASLERDVVVVAAVVGVDVAHHVDYESFAVDAPDGVLEAAAVVVAAAAVGAVVGAAVVAVDVEADVDAAAENAKANAHEGGEKLALGSPYDC